MTLAISHQFLHFFPCPPKTPIPPSPAAVPGPIWGGAAAARLAASLCGRRHPLAAAQGAAAGRTARAEGHAAAWCLRRKTGLGDFMN